MRFAGNFLKNNAAVAVGRSLTALTALQTLNMSGKAQCVALLCGVYFDAREGVATRVGCVWALLYRRCVLQGTVSKNGLVLLWVNH